MGFLDTIKDVVTLVQKTDNIDLLKRVLELQTQAVDLFQENQHLKAEVAALSATLDTAKALTFKSPFYFAAGDPEPLCRQPLGIGPKTRAHASPFRAPLQLPRLQQGRGLAVT